jgi:Uncharacterized proteins, homologs of microcin C7 resistance protein MccF
LALFAPPVICPLTKTLTCQQTLQSWGFQVRLGKTVGHQHYYFSGTDAERLQDLQQMIDDPTVDAILCGRGGYGTSRIIDQLNWKKFRQHPKWIIGFSDITVLHSFLIAKLRTASLHAPMANAFNDGGAQDEYVQSLRKALTGKNANYTCAVHACNKQGKASGQLIGGNLSLMAHQIGTPSDVDTKGKILFLEDVGEYLYNVDRMLFAIRQSWQTQIIGGLNYWRLHRQQRHYYSIRQYH